MACSEKHPTAAASWWWDVGEERIEALLCWTEGKRGLSPTTALFANTVGYLGRKQCRASTSTAPARDTGMIQAEDPG